jgi:chromosome segregation ATPase
MAIQDMDDLLRQLRQHPEWRDALRREILTEELLSLPQIVRELAEAQKHTEERLGALTVRVEELAEAQKHTEERLGSLTVRVEELAEAQKHTEERLGSLTVRVEELAEAQRRTEERLGTLTVRVEELAEAQRRTEERLGTLTVRVEELAEVTSRLEGRVGGIDGRLFEREYANKAYAYFDDLLRKIRVLPWSEVADLLDLAEERVSRKERKQVMEADLILHGRRSEDKMETYLLSEVSIGIGLEDVHRAAQRSKILSRATEKPVIPAVGGKSITPEAKELAQELGVSVFLDGGFQAE